MSRFKLALGVLGFLILKTSVGIAVEVCDRSPQVIYLFESITGKKCEQIQLQDLNKIKQMTIYNGEEPLRVGDFENLPALTALTIANSQDLSQYSEVLFQPLTGLTALYIDGATKISPTILNGLVQLKRFVLSNSLIENLPPNLFQGLTNLKNIGIFNNRRIWRLPANLFNNLTSLRTIDLSGNVLERIEDEQFVGLGDLMGVDLRFNRIEEIQSTNVFSSDVFSEFAEVNLFGNNLSAATKTLLKNQLHGRFLMKDSCTICYP